ncbi:MAG: hypothetical protein WCL14_08285 [Bacteroidota bacterium]
MKKVIVLARILFNFANMNVNDLLQFALGIKAKIAIDPDIHIDAPTQLLLTNEIAAVQGIVTTRETNASGDLTKAEQILVTNLIITLVTIAHNVQDGANKIAAGVTASAEVIIVRIGFKLIVIGAKAGRTFEVVKASSLTAALRKKALARGTIYHWRWSSDQLIWHRVKDTQGSAVTITALPGGKDCYFQEAETLPLGPNPIVQALGGEPAWGDTIHETIPS